MLALAASLALALGDTAVYLSRESHQRGDAPAARFDGHSGSHSSRSSSSTPRASRGSSAYDPGTAAEFLHLSQVAYCPKHALGNWSCSDCALPAATNVTVVDDASTDTQAYVAYLPAHQRVVVGFRGTESLLNWITNLNFAKTAAYPKCEGCRVHEGFLQAWKNVETRVTAAVEALLAERPEASLYLTGHSLGGSLSALAAAHLAYSADLTVSGVYTFGEARVGNDAFVAFYNQGTHVSWRLTHYKDPVPHLPMESLGFRHIATEVFYNEPSSSFQVCDSSGEDEKCSDGIAWDSLLYISDHHRYLGMIIDDPQC